MFSIVLTTINNPTLLEDYAKNAKKNGYDCNFLVVPDNKTPKEAEHTVEKIGGEYITSNLMGYVNDDAKRMEGIIRAIERKDEFIILLDDDNFLGDNNCFDYFSRVGTLERFETTYSNNRWVNCCKELKGCNVIPRGMPYSKKNGKHNTKREDQQIVVNAGMWLEHPDIDAIYCLSGEHKCTGLKNEIVLGSKQFCPFNSQNTAILGETLKGYFFPPIYEGKKFKVGRLGDIFAGIFYEVIMHHLGGSILFSKPMSKHIRNSHNYLKDLDYEVAGIIILEDLLPELENIKLESDDWGECLVELLERLEGTKPETKEYLEFYKKEVKKYYNIIKDL
jgi:hypothetical protein